MCVSVCVYMQFYGCVDKFKFETIVVRSFWLCDNILRRPHNFCLRFEFRGNFRIRFRLELGVMVK